MNQNYVKLTRRSMIYNAIRAAGADGELHEKEIKTIYDFAKYLDVTDEQVREVQDLYEEEQKMREKRAAVLFPNGFGAVLKAFDEQKWRYVDYGQKKMQPAMTNVALVLTMI